MSHVSLITLGVRDVAASSSFYESLGWRRSPVSTDDVAFLAGGNVALALWAPQSIADDAGIDEATVAYATNVNSAEEVDQLLERAGSAGATLTKAGSPTDWGGYTGYFRDADGHLWEVAHNPGFPLGDEGQVYLPASDAQVAEQEAEAAAVDASLGEFIEDAGGEDVRARADAVLSLLQQLWADMEELTSTDSNNAVLATMLELSRRARSLDPRDSDYWRASAGSTLLSGLHGSRRAD